MPRPRNPCELRATRRAVLHDLVVVRCPSKIEGRGLTALLLPNSRPVGARAGALAAKLADSSLNWHSAYWPAIRALGRATVGEHVAGTVSLMSDEYIPNGPFTQAHPMRRSCGSRVNHVAHTDREIQEIGGGKRYMWYACPGWETTHTVTVTAADGTIVGTQNVDLRELSNPDRYLGTNTPELVMIYEARRDKRELAADEIAFGAAAYFVAPEVCPYDCDGCHEHLYPLQSELEGNDDE